MMPGFRIKDGRRREQTAGPDRRRSVRRAKSKEMRKEQKVISKPKVMTDGGALGEQRVLCPVPSALRPVPCALCPQLWALIDKLF